MVREVRVRECCGDRPIAALGGRTCTTAQRPRPTPPHATPSRPRGHTPRCCHHGREPWPRPRPRPGPPPGASPWSLRQRKRFPCFTARTNNVSELPLRWRPIPPAPTTLDGVAGHLATYAGIGPTRRGCHARWRCVASPAGHHYPSELRAPREGLRGGTCDSPGMPSHAGHNCHSSCSEINVTLFRMQASPSPASCGDRDATPSNCTYAGAQASSLLGSHPLRARHH